VTSHTDDVVVVLLDGELDLGTGVRVSKTQNRTVDVSGLELLDQLLAVLTKATEQICDNFAGFRRLAVQVGESSLNASGQVATPP
jgi:hypothetical protein